MRDKRKILISIIIAIATVFCNFSAYAASLQPMAEQKEFGVSMLLVCYMGNDIRSSPEQGEAYAGHSFLVFHNESTFTVRIGHMNVAPDDYVTIGTFGNRSTHIGIWYNIEGHVQPENCIALSHYISTEYELTLINDRINSIGADTFSDDDDGNNSADFAVHIWNKVASYQFTGNNHSNSELQQDMYIASGCGREVIFNYAPPYKLQNEIAYQTTTGVTYSANGASAH